MNKRTRAAKADRAQSDDKSTRQNLLETAGQIIAEKGFDRATGKEICDQARANVAAINYYFGGMEGLYHAILHEAPLKFVSVEAVTAAIADKHDAKAKLEAVIGLMVGALTAQEQEQSSWALRVMAREMIAPSPALEALRQKQMYPKARILKSIVAELMALPEDHPAVARVFERHGAVRISVDLRPRASQTYLSSVGPYARRCAGPDPSHGPVHARRSVGRRGRRPRRVASLRQAGGRRGKTKSAGFARELRPFGRLPDPSALPPRPIFHQIGTSITLPARLQDRRMSGSISARSERA